jgi:hypothetical protein
MVLRSIPLSILLWLWGMPNGHACSLGPPGTPEPTEEDLFSKASAVFIGHLTKTEEIMPRGKGKYEAGEIEGTFNLVEVLKGEPPADHKIKSMIYGPGNCTLPLLSGFDYILFTNNDDKYITTFSGSSAELNLDAPRVRERLERLRALKK